MSTERKVTIIEPISQKVDAESTTVPDKLRVAAYRVLTMNEFFPLNKIFVEKNYLPFEPVTMLFRYEEWTVEEMEKYLLLIAEKAIQYRFNG